MKNQRVRWHRGLIDSLLKHKKMFANPRYGVVGMLSMPYFVLVEMLGPVIEMIGYIILIIALVLGILSKFFILIFLMAYLYGLFFSLSAIFLEQYSYRRYSILEITKLILFSFLEQLSYRQLTVLWRTNGFFNFRKGSKNWGTIKRSKFNEEK
jgi:cellulose synthase/poly-beta-1,6-N-acetylglucosamine synthase-like glycosyltransferase